MERGIDDETRGMRGDENEKEQDLQILAPHFFIYPNGFSREHKGEDD